MRAFCRSGFCMAGASQLCILALAVADCCNKTEQKAAGALTIISGEYSCHRIKVEEGGGTQIIVHDTAL